MCIGAHRCDVPRITITVDDEQNAWLAERADERDRSKSWIASECIDAVRTDAERITPNHRDELTERVDELEERLVNLEDDTPTPSKAPERRVSEPAPEPTESPETNGGARDGDSRLSDIADCIDVPEPHTDERRAGIRAALDLLRDQGTASSSELREEAWKADGGTYADDESWWSNVWKGGASDELQESGIVELENKYAGTWKWGGD